MSRNLRPALGCVPTAGACLGGAGLSLLLTVPPSDKLALWWPSGIAVGVLTRFGCGLWPGVLLATLVTALAAGGGVLLESHAGIVAGCGDRVTS